MNTMQGAVLPGNRRVELREFEVPEPGPGQVLVRMKASSLCGSDLRAIYRPTKQGSGPEAYRGVIAGHEPCGQIERVGPGVERFSVGDRVVLYHIVGCGVCADCRAGWMISCKSPSRAAYGWQRDGGHADFLLAEQSTLVPLPDSLTYADGALVACGFGTAWAALMRAQVSGADTVLVTGLGPVGLAAVMLARALGAQVMAVESIDERRELAAELGAEPVFEPSDDTAETVRRHTAGHGPEVCIECSGNEQARGLCLEVTRDWGRIVFVGEGGSAQFEPSPTLIHRQLALFGSWVCSVPQMEQLVERLDRWQLHPEATVTHRYRLEQVKQAYEAFDSGRTGKVVIEWT